MCQAPGRSAKAAVKNTAGVGNGVRGRGPTLCGSVGVDGPLVGSVEWLLHSPHVGPGGAGWATCEIRGAGVGR